MYKGIKNKYTWDVLKHGARIVLNTLYRLGYELPEEDYSEFLQEVRKELNSDFPIIMRKHKNLKLLEERVE